MPEVLKNCQTCGCLIPDGPGYLCAECLRRVGQSEAHRETDVEELMKRINRLLQAVGDSAHCRGCGAMIFWVRHRNGKKTPYGPTGLNHFAECALAHQFRRPGGAP